MKGTGVLVVPFEGVKMQFWYLIGSASKGPQRQLAFTLFLGYR